MIFGSHVRRGNAGPERFASRVLRMVQSVSSRALEQEKRKALDLRL